MSLDVQAWVFVGLYILAGVGFAGLLKAAMPDMDADDELALTACAFWWLALPVIGLVRLINAGVGVVDKVRGKRGQGQG